MTDQKHDPYAHKSLDAKWEISPYSADNSGSCFAFCSWPNGDMWVSDDKIPLAERSWQAYRRDERMAVIKAIVAGTEKTPFVLTEAERRELIALLETRNPGLLLSR